LRQVGKHEAKEEEAVGEDHRRRCRLRQREEDGHEARFQEEGVPLEGEKFLTGSGKGEVEQPENQKERHCRRSGDKQK